MSRLTNIILLFLIISVSTVSVSCTRVPEIPKTHTAAEALCATEINLPAGKIYSTDFEAESPKYLSRELLSAYFDITDIEKYAKDWSSCSIFLPSGSHACEFAVICCSTPESLTDTSRLLSARLEAIKKQGSTEFSAYFESARVLNRGNLAVLIISCDTNAAVKALKAVT